MPRFRLAYKILGFIFLAGLALIFLPENHQEFTPIYAGANTKIEANHPVATFSVDSSATTISGAFAQANQPYYPQDHIQVFPSLANGMGGVVTVTRAMPITVVDGTKTYQARTWATTVEGLLTEQNIELGDQDQIAPSSKTTLQPNQTIAITRVAVTQLTQTGPIAFALTKQNDNTLNKGLTKVKQKGVNGVMTYVYQVRRENGVEVARTLLSQTTTTASVTEIDLIGTKPVITTTCGTSVEQAWILDASIQYSLDPNSLCYRMIKESNGNPNSDGSAHKGLFQYDPNYWATESAKVSGFAGASIWDGHAQVYVTAYAWSHGDRGRWPTP